MHIYVFTLINNVYLYIIELRYCKNRFIDTNTTLASFKPFAIQMTLVNTNSGLSERILMIN